MSAVSEPIVLGDAMRQRVKALQSLVTWSEGSSAQEDDARHVLKTLLADLSSVLQHAKLDASGRLYDAVDRAIAAANAPRFDRKRILSELKLIVRHWPKLRQSRHWLRIRPAALGGIFAVLALLLGLTYLFLPTLAYPLSATRMADFITLTGALERYKADYGHYPISRNAGGGNDWTGINWNGVGENWLPDLVPKYLAKLPRDPRNTNIQHAQYIYFSNGTDYKLLSMNAEECRLMVSQRPWMNDAVRNKNGVCMTYGLQTPGAAGW